MALKTIEFMGYKTLIPESALQNETIHVDFNGQIKCLFEKVDGNFICIDAMNGYGDSISDTATGKQLNILQ